MKIFFAYRLPGKSEPVWIEGNAMRVSELTSIPKDGFVFHSFFGDEIYILQEYTVINETQFLCFISEESTQKSVTKNEYESQFATYQNELQSGRFQKLILSRVKKMNTKKSALELFHDLNLKYPTSYNTIFSSAETGTWIGASPELLLRSEGTKIETVALAGTKPADVQTAWTTKEEKEQAFVTDYILAVLRQNQLQQITVSEPYTITAGSIQHIKTDISAQLNSDNQLLSILKDLHPTPATCGIPTKDALKKIKETESHERKFYAGFFGIIQNGRSEFFVNLRCMELFSEFALLYVGGGITKESEVEKEWIETEKKAETLGKLL
ncbi:MAG: isochorismate synthase [Crocinitomicaceae bacterium]|nr:isochorismate synthase [Crocinitomicaceae bacterium]